MSGDPLRLLISGAMGIATLLLLQRGLTWWEQWRTNSAARHAILNTAAARGVNSAEFKKRVGQIEFSEKELELLNSGAIISPDDVTVTFDDVGGCEEAKRALREAVLLPLERPELFRRTGSQALRATTGVLLYGPPGTGKTLLAKVIARESRSFFINVNIADLTSKWFGESNKLVHALFSLAHKLAPAIIFIDELDALFRARGSSATNESEASLQLKCVTMQCWDGLLDASDRVVVIGCTNRVGDIDPAILRRLPRQVEVPLPNARQRVLILDKMLRGEERVSLVDLDLNKLADAAEGFSGSDLRELCTAALSRPIGEMIESNMRVPRACKQEDFEKVLSSMRDSVHRRNDSSGSSLSILRAMARAAGTSSDSSAAGSAAGSIASSSASSPMRARRLSDSPLD